MNQTIFILVIATLCIIATNFSSNTVCPPCSIYHLRPHRPGYGQHQYGSPGLRHRSRGLLRFRHSPSTMPMAVVAGTGWVDVKDMFKYGGLMALLSIVILAFVGYPIAAAVL